MPIPNEVTFRDLNITFNKHPVTGRLPLLENNDAVIRAVKNIVLTNHYERPYQPKFGANIRAKLFEHIDEFTVHEIKRDIEVALKNFETRVIVNDIKVIADEERNGVSVTLIFTVVNQPNPIQATFFLERVR
jgi:phage baseplate assembly protein W